HWMRLRGPARRHPTAALGREDQRPAALAEVRETARQVERAVPELQAEVGQRLRQRGWVTHEPELGQPLVLDPLVSDHFDDVPGRIVEVERLRVPGLEVEDDLTGLAV